MRKLLFAGLIAVFCAAASAAGTLESLRGEYRVIAVFTVTDSFAREMIDELTQTDGFEVRDIAWFVLGPETFRTNMEAAIRRRSDLVVLHRASGFEAVLVGKDGRVKARQTEELDVSEFIDLIDHMLPLRQ